MIAGDHCPECKGTLDYPPVENCSCHINPPCSAGTGNPLTGEECGWEEEEAPEYKEVDMVRQNKPKSLDNTKIDYRAKMHTHFSMIKEGVYPSGTTMAEVRKKVAGTFGGKFEEFGEGHFKFIAYTD